MENNFGNTLTVEIKFLPYSVNCAKLKKICLLLHIIFLKNEIFYLYKSYSKQNIIFVKVKIFVTSLHQPPGLNKYILEYMALYAL